METQVKCTLSLEFHKIETELTEPASYCLCCMELVYLRSILSCPIIIHAKKKNSPEEKEEKKGFIGK